MGPRLGNYRLGARTVATTAADRPLAPVPSARGVPSVLCAIVLLAGGCAGYQLGNYSLYPAEIRTVAVPVFESDSFRRGLGERLTEAVVKQIELVTPYKVVSGRAADSTLSGRIVGESKRVVVGSRAGDPRELEMDLRVEVSWVDHRGNLIRPPTYVPLPPELIDVAATGSLIPELGHSVGTAHQQAISRLAEQIVSMMEAPW